MRVLFLGNNWVGWQVARWLEEQGEEIVGLVIHPPQKRRYGEEIIDSAKVDQTSIFDGAKLRQTKTLEAIKELQPDIGVSAFFGYILHPQWPWTDARWMCEHPPCPASVQPRGIPQCVEHS